MARGNLFPQLLVFGVLVSSTAAWAVADEDSAKELLEEKGLRLAGSSVVLLDEAEFAKKVDQLSSLKRKLASAVKALNAVEEKQASGEAEIRRLTQASAELNAQLAEFNSANQFQYNRLVGAVNANQAQIRLIVQSLQEHETKINEARKAASTAREAYVEKILSLQGEAQRLEKQQQEIAGDEAVQKAVKELSAASDKPLKLELSRSFESNVRKLATHEKSVVTDKIALRRRGNSFFANVVIDGKHTHEMVVDSGASLLTLPYNVAVESGIRFSESDPKITLVIANGQQIQGRLKTLDSVRVGRFTVEDVQCAVLGPEAREATPLLGMSYLGRFKFQLNADSSELSLMKIDGEGPAKKPQAKASTKSASKVPTKSSSKSSSRKGAKRGTDSKNADDSQ